MDISYLADYLAVAETLNFSKAAKDRNISQPAISNHIRALEKELGVHLLERSRRKVSLTQEGRMLLVDAQKILDAFEQMHRFYGRKLIDNHVITVGGFLENQSVLGLLASRLRDFSAEVSTEVRMLCDSAPFEQLSSKLEEGKLDVFVGYKDIFEGAGFPSLRSIPFYRDSFFVALNKKNPLAERQSLKLSDLQDLLFIRLASPLFSSGWSQVVEACEACGFTPKSHSVFIDTAYNFPFMEIASNKCFVLAFFSGGLALQSRSDLTVIPVEDAFFDISLFYNKDNDHELFADFIRYLVDRGPTSSQHIPQ